MCCANVTFALYFLFGKYKVITAGVCFTCKYGANIGFALQVNLIKTKCSEMLATIVNSCLSAADLSIYHIFSSCWIWFALECRYWINAVFTIFASRANSIQQWNLPRGKHKQIWSNVVFTSYSHWFCSCCKSIFFEQCCKHSCHSHALILSP